MTKKKPKKSNVWRGSYFPPGWFPDGSVGAAREDGRLGGPSGFKGGRPSEKPTNVDIKVRFGALFAQHDSLAEARAALVTELHEQHSVTVQTARTWLRLAGIPK